MTRANPIFSKISSESETLGVASPLYYRVMEINHEKALVEKAKTDSEAFGELYREYYDRIFGYVLRRTADLQRTQDITSVVFIKAIKGIRTFQWKGIPFSAWLYRVASREIAENYRRDGHYQLDNNLGDLDKLESSEFFRANTQLEKYDEFISLHSSFSTLPAKYQEVIALRYFEDKEINEIAAILNKPENSVKTLLHRGIERLRSMLDK